MGLVVGRLVTLVVQGLLALQELPGQETAGNQRRLDVFLEIKRSDLRTRGVTYYLHCGEVGAGIAVRVPVVAGTVTQLPDIILSAQLSVFYCTLLSLIAGHCQEQHRQYCQHHHHCLSSQWFEGGTPPSLFTL